MVIKGILDPEDARDAVRFGADGIVVLTTVAASWTVCSLLPVHCLLLQMP